MDPESLSIDHLVPFGHIGVSLAPEEKRKNKFALDRAERVRTLSHDSRIGSHWGTNKSGRICRSKVDKVCEDTCSFHDPMKQLPNKKRRATTTAQNDPRRSSKRF
eukprot:jgi/Bigna1/143640/aug1.80_g18348